MSTNNHMPQTSVKIVFLNQHALQSRQCKIQNKYPVYDGHNSTAIYVSRKHVIKFYYFNGIQMSCNLNMRQSFAIWFRDVPQRAQNPIGFWQGHTQHKTNYKFKNTTPCTVYFVTHADFQKLFLWIFGTGVRWQT